MNDNDTPFFPSNQPEWRLLAAAGALVVCLTAVWLPFGIIGFASFLYLAVLLRPLAPSLSPPSSFPILSVCLSVSPPSSLSRSLALSLSRARVLVQG